MEEDIKILEFWKESEIVFPLQNVRKPIFPEREKQALENLIKEYKRLKNDNAVLMADMIRKSIADTIPKSKVKEKMEKLDKKIRKIENKKVWNEPADTVIRNRLCNYYNALKELMEDK